MHQVCGTTKSYTWVQDPTVACLSILTCLERNHNPQGSGHSVRVCHYTMAVLGSTKGMNWNHLLAWHKANSKYIKKEMARQFVCVVHVDIKNKDMTLFYVYLYFFCNVKIKLIKEYFSEKAIHSVKALTRSVIFLGCGVLERHTIPFHWKFHWVLSI